MAFAFAGTYGPELINDSTGKPLSHLQVYVYAHTTTTPIQLYTDRTMTTETANPVLTDLRGNLTFYCAPGVVDIFGNDTRLSVVVPADPADVTEKAGDTMTGPLILSEDPAVSLEAATKEYVDTHGGGGGAVTQVFGRTGAITAHTGDYTVGQITGAAPLASPTFTGTVTVPDGAALGTPASLTLTSATGLPESGVTNLTSDLALKAPLASPTFTGVPLAPTATLGTNTTQLATTAFVAAAVAAGGGVLTGDVTTVGTAATLQATANVEQIARQQFLNQLQPPQGSLYINGQNLVAVGGLSFTGTGSGMTGLNSLTYTDGTPSHGQIVMSVSALLAGMQVYANSTDAQPVLAAGYTVIDDIGGNPAGELKLGTGGSTGPDVTLQRSAANTLAISATAGSIFNGTVSVNDGTAGHGLAAMSVNSPSVYVYGTSTDTQPVVGIANLLGSPVLVFGPGGTTVPDISVQRTASNTLKVSASSGTTFTGGVSIADGTAGHGSITTSLNLPILSLFHASTDANPVAQMVDYLGASSGAVLFGPGGSTAVDVKLIRSAANALQIAATAGTSFVGAVSIADATAGHGSIVTALNAPALSLFANSGDSVAAAKLGTTGLTLGAGGSTAADVIFVRASAGLLSLTDGTAGDGKVTLTVGSLGQSVQLFQNSGNSQPDINLVTSSFGSFTGIQFGPGGSTATDAKIARSGTAAMTIQGDTTFFNRVIVSAQANPVTLNQTTTGPGNPTSNTDMRMCVYKGSGGTNYFLLFAWNDGGTVRYKYMLLNSTNVTWATGTSLPT